MSRHVYCIAVAALACCSVSALEISISLENSEVRRGASRPVEGLVADLELRNDNTVPLLLPRPVLHEAAAPGQTTRAVIRRVEEDGTLSNPVPVVRDQEKGFDEQDVRPVNIQPGETLTIPVNVGAVYDVLKAGKYRMYMEFTGLKSNEVEFALLPLRPIDIPMTVAAKNLQELERGNIDYLEMFYVVPSERSWDEIVVVYRLGRKEENEFIIRNVGYLPRGQMPEMVMSEPGIYGLLFQDKVKNGWRFVLVDLKAEPPVFNFKHLEQKEKPTLETGVDGKPSVR